MFNRIYDFSENNELTFEELVDYIKDSTKPLVYTIGLSYRNPTTHKEPRTKEEILEVLNRTTWVIVTEEDDVIHVNELSSNDMY